MPEGITITGVDAVCRTLRAFPKLMAMECLGNALRKAATVFEDELRARCPEAEYPSTSTEKYGHLVDALKSIVTIDTEGRGGQAQIGFPRKSMVALWLEYGHQIGPRGGRLAKGAKAQGFVKPHPFMRAAYEAVADKAMEVFVAEIESWMAQGGDLSGRAA